MFSFMFRNNNEVEFSSKDIGILINKRSPLPKPQKILNCIKVPGRNGTLIEDTEAYENVELEFECTIMDDLEHNSILINSWLNGQGDLYLNWLEGYKYKVENVIFNGINIDIVGEFTVKFICEPFRYLEDETIKISNNNSTIYNLGTYESNPYIKIFGTGDFILSINNKSLQIKGCEKYIELDSEIMECYKDNLNCNNKMIGEFPIFKVRENKINWTGNINKMEIIPHWRCL